MTVSTLWLLLLRSFILVSATARLAAPVAMTCSTSSVQSTDSCRKGMFLARFQGTQDRSIAISLNHKDLKVVSRPRNLLQGLRLAQCSLNNPCKKICFCCRAVSDEARGGGDLDCLRDVESRGLCGVNFQASLASRAVKQISELLIVNL